MYSRIIIYAGKIFYLLCPEIVIKSGISFLRIIQNICCGQIVSNKEIVDFGQKDKHVFFGYYDVSPFNHDDELLLAIRVPLTNKAPTIGDYAEIGYYRIRESGSGFVVLGKTDTWCWQQGCRLQWYGKEENQVVYNSMLDGRYGAVIQGVLDGNIIKKIYKPLYSISNDGKWGLSLDFSRLQRLRPGYGYGALPDKSAHDFIPDYNGIELVNLETDEFHQLFSLKEISKIEPHDSMDGAEHYFNHLMFNSSGNKFLFFHLWVKSGKRHSRLFVADRDGSHLKLLNNDGSVSHYNWISENEIVLYSFVKEIGKYAYAIFSSDGTVKYFGKNIPIRDGHPTFLKSSNALIVDTYPDLLSQRSLLIYKIKEYKTKVLARFDSPRNFTGEFRCDLHPRVSHDRKMISVDRIVDGKRNISVIFKAL